MTSIFTGLFSETISRVNARADHEPKVKTQRDSAGKDFAELLADLEKTEKNERDSNPLATSRDSAEIAQPREAPPLTNLSESERNLARGRLDAGAYRLTSEEILLPGSTEPQVASVKTTGFDVKNPALAIDSAAPTPPQPVLPKRPPAPPQLISAERTTNNPGGSPRSGLAVSLPSEELLDIITTAGRFHGVEPALTLAVAEAESSFRPDAVSLDGHESKGLFQLLDSTAQDLMEMQQIDGSYDPFDPALNSILGVRYLRELMAMFSAPTKLSKWTATRAAKNSAELEKLAVAAFNAGQGNVARAQALAEADGKDPGFYADVAGYLPASTQQYVRRVSNHKQKYAQSISANKFA